MNRLSYITAILILTLLSCNSSGPENTTEPLDSMNSMGGLLTTNYKSFEEFLEVVKMEYSSNGKPSVTLTHKSNGATVTCRLGSGVSENDFLRAKEGGFWDKVRLTFLSPYFVINRKDLLRVYILSRRRHKDFGWKDVAFYDLAEAMKNNIYEEDKQASTEDELSEKGYINSFNHIAAQAIMTTLFDEKLADYVADTHERKNMPELITGDFTKEQLEDIKFGAVDNYVDIVNNEWGQELGKFLKSKYAIDRSTEWTPELMSKYLNDIQSYFGRVFQIRLNAFTAQDHVSRQFSKKLNHIMDAVSGMW